MSSVDNGSDFFKLINSEEFRSLYNYYCHETFMDVVGTARLENAHSGFLAWLFDDTKQHGLGTFALKKLLETIVTKYKSLPKEHKATYFTDPDNFLNADDLINSVSFMRYKIDDVTVEREWSGWDDASRLDIWISFNFISGNDVKNQVNRVAIAIENKVDSQENQYSGKSGKEYQTEKYWELLKNAAPDLEARSVEFFLPVFLTPLTDEAYSRYMSESNNIAGEAKSRQFFTLNYQTLLDGVLDKCLQRIENPHAKTLLTDYIRCLGQATLTRESIVTEKKTEKTQNSITLMAVSDAERKLISRIWENHAPALLRILQDAILAESSKDIPVDKADNYCDYYLHQPTRQFYRSLFFATAYSGEIARSDTAKAGDIKENAEISNLFIQYRNAVNRSANKKPYFIFSPKNIALPNVEGKYESHKQKPKSLGWLGHELIKVYCMAKPEQTDHLISLLRNTFNPQRKPNLWIGMACVRRKEMQDELAQFVCNGCAVETDVNNSKSAYHLWKPNEYFIDDELLVNGVRLDFSPTSLFNKIDSVSVDGKNAIRVDNDHDNDLFVSRWWGENHILTLLALLKDFYAFDEDTRTIKQISGR